MLAFAWEWGVPSAQQAPFRGDAGRLAASLCAGIGGEAGQASIGAQHFAFRPLIRPALPLRSWKPARMDDGRLVAFHGYFDNAETLARELGERPNDPAWLYGRALAAWGDDADLRIIGEYCTIVTDADSARVRLARSPLKAPPLSYHQNAHFVAAASVPRAILAAGLEPRWNEARAADSAMINFTDPESDWYLDMAKVPLGSVVTLAAGCPRQLRVYYDLASAARPQTGTRAELVEKTRALLDEAVRITLRGFSSPGATLSAGLDSPQVAARAAALMPAGKKLKTFTFHPEAGFDGTVSTGFEANERPAVEAFAAQHPAIEPHFSDNAGYGHDHRWNDLFLLMGGAPSGLCNMYVFHGLFAQARAQRCDVLLLAEWGNFTFSDKGDWGYVEYFLKGRWGQLWKALKHGNPHDRRGMARRFVAHCLVPLLPDRLWKLLMRVWHRDMPSVLDLMIPLSAGYRAASGAEHRLRASGLNFARYQPRSRAHARKLLFSNLHAESDEIYQAFEQMYAVPCRDPLAWRPLVEFCFGLPTGMFMHDGKLRWLAKELARGIMPEKQRENRLNGRWDADWHLRIKRQLPAYLAELDRIEADPELGQMIDVARLRQALSNFPETTSTDPVEFYPLEFAAMRGLLAARWIKFARGDNH